MLAAAGAASRSESSGCGGERLGPNPVGDDASTVERENHATHRRNRVVRACVRGMDREARPILAWSCCGPVWPFASRGIAWGSLAVAGKEG